MAYLALQGAYMQDPLITIRVVIFASWGKERTSPESTASVSHPRTRSSCGFWLPFPPSSKVWTIDSSWSLQNSSLVYLGGEFGLCLLWPDLLQTGQQSPASTQGFSVNHISSSVPLALILGHLSFLSFLVPDGMFRRRLLQPCLQDQWDLLDDQFQVSWFPPYREFFFSSGLEWPSCFSSPRSQLLIRRFGCGLQALIGEHHT